MFGDTLLHATFEACSESVKHVAFNLKVACWDDLLGGSKKTKVKKLEGALSNPIPLVLRSSEQFLFLRLHVWKALPSIFSTSMGISMGK